MHSIDRLAIVDPLDAVNKGCALDSLEPDVGLDFRATLHKPCGEGQFDLDRIVGTPVPLDSREAFLQLNQDRVVVNLDRGTSLQIVEVAVESARQQFVAGPSGDSQVDREFFDTFGFEGDADLAFPRIICRLDDFGTIGCGLDLCPATREQVHV